MVLDTDSETPPFSRDSATAPPGFGSVTSAIHQGTQESRPPTHQEVGTQTLVQAVDPEVPWLWWGAPEVSPPNSVRQEILKGPVTELQPVLASHKWADTGTSQETILSIPLKIQKGPYIWL